HPADGVADDLLRTPLELLGERALAQAAGVSGVTVVALLLQLLAGDPDALAVDHDNEVAGVDVRRVGRLPLAAQRVGDARGKAPEGLAVGVDDVPLARDLARLRGVGLLRHDGGR